MSTPRISRCINAPRAAVYCALLDARPETGTRMALARLAVLVEGE